MNQSINPSILKKFESVLGKIITVSYPKIQGGTSEVTIFHTEKGDFVCKNTSKPKYREWLSHEAQQMKILNEQTSLPIPTFYQFVKEEHESCLLMSLENGVPLREALEEANSEEERALLFQGFGTLLKQMHKTSPPTSWLIKENWLDTQLEKATYYLENYQVEGNQRLLDTLKKKKPTPSKQTLIHGDCTIDNVLVTNGKVHTFIDLAGASYGDPRYDIALAIRSIKKNELLLNAFYKGYNGKVITDDEFTYFDGGLYEFF